MGGGGVKPILAMPGFWTLWLLQSLPYCNLVKLDYLRRDVVYLHKAGNIHMQHDESQPRIIIIMIIIQKPTPTNAARIGLVHSGISKIDFEVQSVAF